MGSLESYKLLVMKGDPESAFLCLVVTVNTVMRSVEDSIVFVTLNPVA